MWFNMDNVVATLFFSILTWISYIIQKLTVTREQNVIMQQSKQVT